MCEFQMSSIMLYTHIPASLIALFFCIFIFYANKHSSLNKNLALITLILSLWITDHVVRSVTMDMGTRLLLQRLEIIAAFFVPFFLFFVYGFVRKPLVLWKQILILAPFLLIFPLLFSDFNIAPLRASECIFKKGLLYPYIIMVSMGYVVWALYLLKEYYFSSTIEYIRKKQTRLVFLALAFIVGWIASYLLAVGYFEHLGHYDIAMEIMMYLPLGMLIFIWILTYAITKYELLEFGFFSARMLVFAIWILFGANYLFANGIEEQLLALLSLLLSLLYGIILLREEEKEHFENIELHAVNEKLKDMDATRSDFVSILAHQLRTPLTTEKGFLSLMRRGTYGKLNKELRDAVERVQNSNERVLHLVNDLLNVSKIETGRMQFEFTRQCLGDVVKEVCDSLSPLAKEKKLSFEIMLPKRMESGMKFDQTKLREAIHNVIENAIKYTKKGKVSVVMKKGKDSVIITVADTGTGMTKEDLEKIFEKYTRGCNSDNVCSNGLGLGLYFGKKVIEAHKGTIKAQSRGLEKGSKFIIELPFLNN